MRYSILILCYIPHRHCHLLPDSSPRKVTSRSRERSEYKSRPLILNGKAEEMGNRALLPEASLTASSHAGRDRQDSVYLAIMISWWIQVLWLLEPAQVCTAVFIFSPSLFALASGTAVKGSACSASPTGSLPEAPVKTQHKLVITGLQKRGHPRPPATT